MNNTNAYLIRLNWMKNSKNKTLLAGSTANLGLLFSLLIFDRADLFFLF